MSEVVPAGAEVALEADASAQTTALEAPHNLMQAEAAHQGTREVPALQGEEVRSEGASSQQDNLFLRLDQRQEAGPIHEPDASPVQGEDAPDFYARDEEGFAKGWSFNDLFSKSNIGEEASRRSAEIYGPAWEKNPDDYQRIIADVQQNGGEVKLDDTMPLGTGAYVLGDPGQPGTLKANRDVDISTLEHEYEHFRMDRELGFPGLRHYIEHPQLFVDGEKQAYDVEINRAVREGHTDLAQLLEAAKQERVEQIREHYGLD